MDDIYFDNIKVFNNISIEESYDLAIFFTQNNYLLLKNVLTDEIKNYFKYKYII